MHIKTEDFYMGAFDAQRGRAFSNFNHVKTIKKH